MTTSILQVLVNGILVGSVYALASAGLSLIWGVMEIVNFAHADYLMFATYVTYVLWAYLGLDPLFALPLVILVFLLVSYGTHKLLTRRLIGAPPLIVIVATFAISLIIRYSIFAIFGPDYRAIRSPILSGSFFIGDICFPIAKTGTLLVSTITIGFLFLFLRFTRMGKAIRATAQDREVAEALGIDVKKVFLLTWAVGLGCVAVAGTMLANFLYISPILAPIFTNVLFACVALGGFGSVHGAIFGGLVIGLVQQLGGFYTTPALKDLWVFAVFLAVMLFKPMGFWGKY